MPAEDRLPIEKPTGLHRYVKRSEGPPRMIEGASILSPEQPRTLRIHQQQWSVVDFTTGSNGVERLEWRDVPLVVEDTDEAQDAVRREERIARADASLAKQLQISIERNAELNAIVQRQGKALEWIVNDPGAHPANMVAVAKQGLGRS